MGTRASEAAARQGRPISKPVRLGKSARTSLERSPPLNESLATSQNHCLAIRIPRRARPGSHPGSWEQGRWCVCTGLTWHLDSGGVQPKAWGPPVTVSEPCIWTWELCTQLRSSGSSRPTRCRPGLLRSGKFNQSREMELEESVRIIPEVS